jgi:putative zinc finger/helix-turn-helix YgiT family protein
MKPAFGPSQVRIHRERFSVSPGHYLKCPSCGEELYGIKEFGRQQDEAYAAYRKKYNLLAPDEVRDVREKSGMTIAAFAVLLRVTEFEASRWESGRSPQSAIMDTVLRMIRDVPGSIDYLRKRAA